MTAPAPMIFVFEDGVMKPLNPARAAREFAAGEHYRMEVREERSEESHRHFFAVVNEAWGNLPEALMEKFPTADHLRKWCLIATGFRDERLYSCGSTAEARRLAAFIKPVDSYAVVVARYNAVVVWTAQSQSMKAMGRKRFQESKDAVLRKVAELIGTDATTLQANAGRAA